MANSLPYREIEEIGRGGMAAVYRAENIQTTGTEAALKRPIVRPHELTPSAVDRATWPVEPVHRRSSSSFETVAARPPQEPWDV